MPPGMLNRDDGCPAAGWLGQRREKHEHCGASAPLSCRVCSVCDQERLPCLDGSDVQLSAQAEAQPIHKARKAPGIRAARISGAGSINGRGADERVHGLHWAAEVAEGGELGVHRSGSGADERAGGELGGGPLCCCR